MNFDAENVDLKLTITGHARGNILHFLALMDGVYREVACVNGCGLFICTQAVEYGQGFKPACANSDWSVFDFFDEAMEKAETASEFLQLLNNKVIRYPTNPLFPHFGLHTIVADKYGDAFILEEQLGAMAITRIDSHSIVMTNFPNGLFQSTAYDKVYGCGADRYILAHQYINNKFRDFEISDAFSVLSATSREDTLCSIVFEPLRSFAYLRIKSVAAQTWKISISDKKIETLDGFAVNGSFPIADDSILLKYLIGVLPLQRA